VDLWICVAAQQHYISVCAATAWVMITIQAAYTYIKQTIHTSHTNIAFVFPKHQLTMKNIIFWDMKPRSLLSCNRRFGGTYRLHLQGRRNNFSKNKQAGGLPPAFTLVSCSAYSSNLKMGGDMFLRNVG
jgi:hypothetical protein